MLTQGSLSSTHIWAEGANRDGSLKLVGVMSISPVRFSCSYVNDVPHREQRPRVTPGDDRYSDISPDVTLNPVLANVAHGTNAPPDALRQLSQWQKQQNLIGPVTANSMSPQKQLPVKT